MTCLHTPTTRLAGPATWAAVALTLAVGCGQKNETNSPSDKPAAQEGQTTDKDELTMLAVGADAPDFTAEAHDGTTIAMKDLQGAPVVVYFYPKDATPG